MAEQRRQVLCVGEWQESNLRRPSQSVTGHSFAFANYVKAEVNLFTYIEIDYRFVFTDFEVLCFGPKENVCPEVKHHV
jgi:hypothetical protein